MADGKPKWISVLKPTVPSVRRSTVYRIHIVSWVRFHCHWNRIWQIWIRWTRVRRLLLRPSNRGLVWVFDSSSVDRSWHSSRDQSATSLLWRYNYTDLLKVGDKDCTICSWDSSHGIGAVHEVCHAIFDDFWPPLSHTVTNLGPPESMSHFWTKS